MKTTSPARKCLLLAALLPVAVALAQNAPKPASKEVQVLTEFRVNTSKDDGFIATESTSGTRIATDISEWSAVIGSAFKKWQNGARLDLSLNVNNLCDEKQMTTAAFYPEGRTVRLTAGLRF